MVVHVRSSVLPSLLLCYLSLVRGTNCKHLESPTQIESYQNKTKRLCTPIKCVMMQDTGIEVPYTF